MIFKSRFSLVVIALLKIAHSVDGLQNEKVHRTSAFTKSSSELPLLPPLESSGKKRQSRKYDAASSIPVLASGKKNSSERTMEHQSALPAKIPRLSEVMRGATVSEFSDQSIEKLALDSNVSHEKGKRREKIFIASKTSTPLHEKTGPWRATFKSSIRTQGRIKKAFAESCKGDTPARKASRVLKTLLNTSPSQCNAANVVCALTYSVKALGPNRHRTNLEFQSLLFETLDILNELVMENLLTTRQLCNAAWAIAKHYDRDDSLLPPPPDVAALSSEAVLGVAEAWSLDEDHNDDKDSLKKAQQTRVDETVDEIARQLTNMLGNNYAQTVDARSQAKVGEICMTTWAFGILRPRHRPPGWQVPPQLGRVPRAVKSQRKQHARTDDNFLTFEQWTSFSTDSEEDKNFSNSEEVTDSLFDAIAEALCRRPNSSNENGNEDFDESITNLQTCSWRDLAVVGWAFASHGSCKSQQAERLLLGLADEASRRLQTGGVATKNFLTRDIAQLVWALGVLQADNFRLGDDLVHLMQALTDYLRVGGWSASFGRGRPLRRWNCPDLVQIALALAHSRIDELPLLRTVYQESCYRLMEGLFIPSKDLGDRRSFQPWEISVLLWAQARLYLKGPQGTEFDDFAVDAPKCIMKVIKETGLSLQQLGIGPQEQANIAWSLTVLEATKTPEATSLINLILLESSKACAENQMIQLEHAHQLWQAYFLLEEENPDAVENVPEWFCKYLREKWTVEKAREKISSARHRSLSQTLELMGVDHYNEHDEDIDVALVLKENAAWTHQSETGTESRRKISVAVEFDGPNHFSRERETNGNNRPVPPRALGHTVLKYRLLKKQGWTVVRVPYYEFDKIPFWASMERQRYLQRKLKTHANLKFSETDVSEYKTIVPNRKSRFD